MKEIKIKGITKKETSLIPRSFDVIGDILVFSNFPFELEKKEKIIGEYFLKKHKNIKVILKKIKQYSGKFRTAQMRVIAGERRKETTYIEHGCKFKLHVEKTYFSPRLSTERGRIYNQIKKGETILVMFSGIAPYPIIISKNSNAKEIWGIEINPIAHKYAKENIILNKIKNVKLFLGDVNTVLPKMKKRFDRIIMPLPKGAGIFLNLALKKIKKEGIIHFYDFFEKEDITKKAKNKINNVHSEKKFKILDIIKCGQYSPGKYRICIDFRIL